MKKNKFTANQKFNKLIFIEFDSIDIHGHEKWKCLCDCGIYKVIRASSVISGATKSCGCLPTNQIENFAGQKFNRYTFVEYKFTDRYRQSHWLCRCDCGNEKIICSNKVKSGLTKSCGCYQKEVASKRKGNKHPKWRKDLTKIERESNRNRNLSPKTRKWRLKVFKRDKYTCQCCGVLKQYLNAHHIYSYHSHKKLRYKTSNGVTLCKNCHRKFHKEFGNKFNTRKQFTKFKNTFKERINNENSASFGI